MEVDEHSQEESGVENQKSVRRRKKNLYKTIQQQMEFYFSDANIKKDKFIQDLVQEDPYVDLSVFLKFNKIASLTNKIDEICFAIEKSDILKLSDDKKKVCRTTPISEKENEDECTIYVERLPEDTTHDWLKEIFSTFGPVDYVSLPKYKHNKRPKGFAFIEFRDNESTKKALAYFESIGCKLTMEMAPNQLASIITFENHENQSFSSENGRKLEDHEKTLDENVGKVAPEKEAKFIAPSKKNKRKLDPENQDSESKKVKVESETEGTDTESEMKIGVKVEADSEVDQSGAETGAMDGVGESDEKAEHGEMETEGGKKKRKRKKHRRSKDDLKQLGLQVLSKKEWKQLRNKYLNMQRIKMKTLKEHLYRHRHLNRQFQEGNPEKMETKSSEDTPNVKSEPKFKFSPDCIIKFSIPEGFTDIKKLKTDIRQNPGVEYIDAHEGKEIGYIRFSDSKMSNDFLESNFFDTSKLLKGQEEKDYWDKVMKDRDTKFSKNQPAKKIRGREKLLKKAEQELGKHIRFEN